MNPDQQAVYLEWYEKAVTATTDALWNARPYPSKEWAQADAKVAIAALGEGGFLQYAVYRWPKSRGAHIDGDARDD